MSQRLRKLSHRALDHTSSLLWRRPGLRVVARIGADVLAWSVALTFAVLVRYNFDPSRIDARGLLAIIPLAMLAQLATGSRFGLYTGRWRFGSLDELVALGASAIITTTLLVLLDFWIAFPRMVPLGAAVAGGLAALTLMAGFRSAGRMLIERRRRPGPGADHLLVFGAGEGGAQVITAMLRNPASPYLPVALIDDDHRKRNLQIMGVPVVGGTAQIRAAADRYECRVLLIAVPSAGAELVRRITDVAVDAALTVKVLPPVEDIIGDRVGFTDIRDLSAADLLGRRRIETDIDSIAGYLTAKRVLVTGAGGSIGSELCRQIYRFAPSELIMLDRDESALHAVQLSIEGRALLDSPNLVLCDLRDGAQVNRTFSDWNPQVVFHAAALKHQPLLERFPSEAVKTNVWGTLDLLSAAARSGVERFVNVSTDKAADPISVLGYSKRITERLTAEFAQRADGAYLSVRFGNVLGSRGSVLETFRKQIAAGGPVTVTHPDVTRFFMTVEEAVELVIQAGAIGRSGDALVLDMGEPVRIADVAQRLAANADRPVDVVFTGLRPGEKLHEVLRARAEPDARPVHPLICHVRVQPLAPELARAIDPDAQASAVIDMLESLCDAPYVRAREQ